jgi:hypothetical protein
MGGGELTSAEMRGGGNCLKGVITAFLLGAHIASHMCGLIFF